MSTKKEKEERKKKKRKRRLTAAQKAEKKRRREQYRTVFINGKMKRVRREPTIDGISVEEFIRRNADPIFLHQAGMWEYIEADDGHWLPGPDAAGGGRSPLTGGRDQLRRRLDDEGDLPF